MKSIKAVMLAGGKGTRLRPYTLVLPKPLIPVGDVPVIESLLKWLRRNGVRDVFITIGYLGHLIKALCPRIERGSGHRPRFERVRKIS
jgi:NDP-sugar pyrophosphorylase family protein